MHSKSWLPKILAVRHSLRLLRFGVANCGKRYFNAAIRLDRCPMDPDDLEIAMDLAKEIELEPEMQTQDLSRLAVRKRSRDCHLLLVLPPARGFLLRQARPCQY